MFLVQLVQIIYTCFLLPCICLQKNNLSASDSKFAQLLNRIYSRLVSLNSPNTAANDKAEYDCGGNYYCKSRTNACSIVKKSITYDSFNKISKMCMYVVYICSFKPCKCIIHITIIPTHLCQHHCRSELNSG